MPDPRLLTVEEAAAAIHATVSTRAIYAMIRDGTLAAVRIERAKLHDVTRHTLKHTAVTWAFMRGMTLEDAADYFSTSPQTLMRVYRQHAPEYQTRAARLMDRRG